MNFCRPWILHDFELIIEVYHLVSYVSIRYMYLIFMCMALYIDSRQQRPAIKAESYECHQLCEYFLTV